MNGIGKRKLETGKVAKKSAPEKTIKKVVIKNKMTETLTRKPRNRSEG